MLKSTAIVLALCAQMVFSHSVVITTSTNRQVELRTPVGRRACACLKHLQPRRIKGVNAGTVKLFAKTDCTGNYSTMLSNGTVDNAYWVNSISFGANIPRPHDYYACGPVIIPFAAADNGQSDAVQIIDV